MKKILAIVCMFVATLTFAQTQAGQSFVGVRATNLGFSTTDGQTSVAVGADVGHFVANNLAVVGNVGFQIADTRNSETSGFAYGAGLKYYLGGVVPVQVDWNGTAVGGDNRVYRSNVGTSLGYAFFLTPKVSLEPTLRYNISLNDNQKNTFSGNFGVNYFF